MFSKPPNLELLLGLYVCTFGPVYVCTDVHIRSHARACRRVRTCVRACAYVCPCVCVRARVRVRTCARVWAYVHAWAYVQACTSSASFGQLYELSTFASPAQQIGRLAVQFRRSITMHNTCGQLMIHEATHFCIISYTSYPQALI